MGPELGRTYPHPRPFSPSLTHVLNEIEKQRIREEVIVSEIVRRRILEAEVRQELMMERELRGLNSGIPIGFESLPTGGERGSLEERIKLRLVEERLRRRVHESGGSETFPFQRHSDDPADKQKGKIILLVKPDEDIDGSKRKAPTPSAGLDSSKSPSQDVGIISSKKAKAEWFCSVCHVSATSEQALNEHLKGRKHKSKEATLRAHRARKNYSIGLFPKDVTKSIEVSASESPQLPQLMENLNSDNLKKDQCEVVLVPEAQKKDDPEKDQSVVPEAQKKEESTKKRFRFWCEMCRIGSYSKNVWNAHKRGKKHARRLEASRQNASDDREKTAVLVNLNREGVIVDGHGKNVTSVDVDEALEEAGPEDHGLVDANKSGVAVECVSQLMRSWPTQM